MSNGLTLSGRRWRLLVEAAVAVAVVIVAAAEITGKRCYLRFFFPVQNTHKKVKAAALVTSGPNLSIRLLFFIELLVQLENAEC